MKLVCLVDYLIVDVGIVSGVCNVVAALYEIFSYNIVDECLIDMSDVSVTRNGDTAGVHFDFVAVHRLEFFFSSRKRVVDFKHLFFLFADRLFRFGEKFL